MNHNKDSSVEDAPAEAVSEKTEVTNMLHGHAATAAYAAPIQAESPLGEYDKTHESTIIASGPSEQVEKATENTEIHTPFTKETTTGNTALGQVIDAAGSSSHHQDISAAHHDNAPTTNPESVASHTTEDALPKQETTVEDGHTDANEVAQEGPEAGGRPESLLVSPLTHPNGVDMFPSLSASEQEEMTWEAFTQAEESIVAEDHGRSLRDDVSDGGYESEGFSSGSTSAESSVRDYMYENGRRYHRFREGAYNFPNDDVEQEREDMKHAMVKLLCGQKLFFSPIGDNPQQMLDIGTGTGIWVIESEYNNYAL